MDLTRIANDPTAYRAALTIPAARGPAKLSDVTAEYQAGDFATMDQAFLALAEGRKPEPGRIWLERTKGASKDTDLAVMLLWLLAFSPRPLACQVGAADLDQADELRKAAKGILRLNTWLSAFVDVQSWSLVNERTDSRCDIIAADVAGSHGARPDLLILNELSHVAKQEFAENLMDNAAKVPHGVVCIATNAGFVPSWQWNWRENARTSPRWFFSAYDRPAPWLELAEIEEARRRNHPIRFARLWQGVWVRGTGDALSADDIQAAITLPLPTLTPPSTAMPADLYRQLAGEPQTDFETVFYAGLDLGISRDHAALVIGGLRRGRVRLASVQSWAPPYGGKIDLAMVQDAVLAAHQHFCLFRCFFDPHQAELMAQNLLREGVPMEAVPFTVPSLQDMATALLERFTSRQVDLFPDEGLIADLHALRLIDRGTSFRLDAPRNSAGHGDRGTAFVLMLLAAERYPAVPYIEQPNEVRVIRIR
jgi:hypothetical protein